MIRAPSPALPVASRSSGNDQALTDEVEHPRISPGRLSFVLEMRLQAHPGFALKKVVEAAGVEPASEMA